MIPVLIQAIVLSAGGILSVGSITIVLLLLLSDRGWRVGLGYASGYLTAYSILGIGGVLVGMQSAATESGEPSPMFYSMFVALGFLLVFLGVRNWRKGLSVNADENAEPPRIFQIVNDLSAPKAFGFGVMIGFANFKNWAFFFSGLSAIILSDLPVTSQLWGALILGMVFTSGVFVPVLIPMMFPEQAQEKLRTFQSWLDSHRHAIGVWLPLVFGLIFVIRGLSG